MSNEADIPLCVDLDGTLVKLDTLHQAVFMLLRRKPTALFQLPGWIAKGKAHLKEQIMSRVEIDATSLPYNENLLNHLREQHQAGRKLVLATASNHRTAKVVANHLNIFTDVLASDESTNLKGKVKLAAIRDKYAAFDYVGNDKADYPLWDAAHKVLMANPSNAARQKYATQAEHIFDDKKSFAKQLFKALRVQQWLKNLLIFAPMFLAHEFKDMGKILNAVIAFFSFSFAASAIYSLNDLFDLSADQHHPRKCRRPYAAGNLPISFGAILAPALAILSLALALMLPTTFLGILLLYFIVTSAYSWRLKQMVIIDVLTLALLYTTRIVAGASATTTEASPWFLNFSIFLFLSLALVKRLAELVEIKRNEEINNNGRERGYKVDDLPILMTFGAVSGYISVFVFTRYLGSEKVEALYAHPELLWLFTPLLLYWITRMWMLTWRGTIKDDPLAFAATDFQTYIIGLLSLAINLIATYPF